MQPASVTTDRPAAAHHSTIGEQQRRASRKGAKAQRTFILLRGFNNSSDSFIQRTLCAFAPLREIFCSDLVAIATWWLLAAPEAARRFLFDRPRAGAPRPGVCRRC